MHKKLVDKELKYLQAVGILFHEDGQHHGEGQHARSTIA